jgi:hypothetical protein
MKDCVYYLKENNELLLEKCFCNEEEAIEYAEVNEMQNYEIIEWEVD